MKILILVTLLSIVTLSFGRVNKNAPIITYPPNAITNTNPSRILHSPPYTTRLRSGIFMLKTRRIYNNIFLSNGNGFTFYVFSSDKPFTSTCFNECAVKWPPVIVTDVNKVFANFTFNRSLLTTFKRPDGNLQLVYNGWPLYYYYLDKQAYDVKGQNVFGSGGYWYTITPQGNPLKMMTYA